MKKKRDDEFENDMFDGLNLDPDKAIYDWQESGRKEKEDKLKNEEEQSYFNDIKKRQKARYEVLKEKYGNK